jgi:hypothetical protein
MARIKFGMMMTDARGKLGGHVFTKAKSGATIRTKVTPLNPKTSAQSEARSALGANSQTWRLLSETQRLAWNSAAQEVSKTNAFGDTYFPSGKNYFTAVNNNIRNVGGVILLNPPALVNMPGLTSVEVDFDLLAEQLDIAPNFIGDEDRIVLVCNATSGQSAGRYNFSGKYRKFDGFSLAGLPTNTAVFDSYVSKFGVPSAGQKVSFEFYLVNPDTGQVSPRVTSTVLLG